MNPDWRPISSPPERDASYIVCAPSEDPAHPLVNIAWFDPRCPIGTRRGWSLLPVMWLDALTHWTELPAPPYGSPAKET